MDIGYGEYVELGGYHYVLTLANKYTWYIWTYGMHTLSNVDIIQALQEFCLGTGHLPIKLYTDFDKKIRGASRKCIM